MRRVLIAVAFLASIVLPNAAFADTYQYTLNWWVSSQPGQSAYQSFNGTYTFSLNERIADPTVVYGPSYTPPMTGPYDYVYAADLTSPSTVNIHTITFDPVTVGQQAYVVYLASSQYGGVNFYLWQSPSDPDLYLNFAAGQASYNVTLNIDDLGPAPAQTPEPSTLMLLGSGMAACAFRARRMFRV
jgi:hypothetical protein